MSESDERQVHPGDEPVPGVADDETAARASQARPTAPRSGMPWTDADYEAILDAVRNGENDLGGVAERIGRAKHTTWAKTKRLLPVAERAAPIDRAMRLIREHLKDPDYDWRQATLEEPPPRPVIQPPALTGIPGLGGSELVAIGYAVALSAATIHHEVVAEVGAQLERRRLLGRLREHRAERLTQQPGAEITWSHAMADAERWIDRVFPATTGASQYWRAVEPERYFDPEPPW